MYNLALYRAIPIIIWKHITYHLVLVLVHVNTSATKSSSLIFMGWPWPELQYIRYMKNVVMNCECQNKYLKYCGSVQIIKWGHEWFHQSINIFMQVTLLEQYHFWLTVLTYPPLHPLIDYYQFFWIPWWLRGTNFIILTFCTLSWYCSCGGWYCSIKEQNRIDSYHCMILPPPCTVWKIWTRLVTLFSFQC